MYRPQFNWLFGPRQISQFHVYTIWYTNTHIRFDFCYTSIDFMHVHLSFRESKNWRVIIVLLVPALIHKNCTLQNILSILMYVCDTFIRNDMYKYESVPSNILLYVKMQY